MRRLAATLWLAFAAGSALAAPPQRVASLNLAADEVLVELLPPGRLVSVTNWADEPGTSNIVGRVPPQVFRFFKADMEKLVSLTPDLVVVSEYTDADFMRQLERSGMQTHRMQGLTSLSGIRGAILDLGRVVGASPAAESLVRRFDATLDDLGRRLKGAKRPRVLYWSSGMTAGEGTAIGALIEAAGAINVGRELGVVGIAPPGKERVFVADPDFVLVGTWALAEESLKDDALLSRLPAVRENHVLSMPTELLVALSQHAAEGCWHLAWKLHPDRIPGPRPPRDG